MAVFGLALALGFAVRLPLLTVSAGATLAALRGPTTEPAMPGSPPAVLAAANMLPPLLALASMPKTDLSTMVLPIQALPAAGPAVVLLAAAMAETQPAKIELPARYAAKSNPPVAASPDLASRAYAHLAEGDRRAAARLFDAALAAGPDPRSPQWQRERDRLGRHWSVDAYALFRDGGGAGPAASPVLGGGQTGTSIAWTVDPLARRPLALIGRINAANDDPQSTQAAVGLRWRPLRDVSISAERLVAVGATARNDWTLRVAAGAQGRRGLAEWSGYGEAGALGNGELYAGGQARALLRLANIGRLRIHTGPGAWASIQTGVMTTDRVDIGPSFVTRAPLGRMSLELSADWRFRVAGNAEPGSGPAVTISTQF